MGNKVQLDGLIALLQTSSISIRENQSSAYNKNKNIRLSLYMPHTERYTMREGTEVAIIAVLGGEGGVQQGWEPNHPLA